MSTPTPRMRSSSRLSGASQQSEQSPMTAPSVPVTPKQDSIAVDLDDITTSFTGMKLQNPGNAFKRSADRMTVEGSPISNSAAHSYSHSNGDDGSVDDSPEDDREDDGGPAVHAIKRIDLNPTPVRKPDSSFGATNVVKSDAIAAAAAARIHNLLIISSGSDDHDTGDHQENALRTALLAGESGCLRREPVRPYVTWLEPAAVSPAPIADLLRVHDFTYIRHLQDKCRASSSTARTGALPPFYAPPGKLDSDTPLVESSLDASRRFCGAAMMAVDRVLGGPFSRAFVLGRPPGHHAGPSGCVPSDLFWRRPDMASSGFCLLNTVAVAAGYARYNYGRRNNGRAPRVAIVDIDVHHGNGTEEIVRNLSPRQSYLPLPSSWAPVAVSTYKPWLDEDDAENVLFASINLYADERFYPCSGGDSCETTNKTAANTAASSSSLGAANIINIAMTPIGPGPWDAKARARLSFNQRSELCAIAGQEMRTKVCGQLLPQLQEFQPDLLLISAGFDAHYDDFYHFLTEADYHWLTQQLCEVTERGGGKVISILEGGYSLSAPVLTKPTKGVRSTHAAPAVVAKTDGAAEPAGRATREGKGKNKKYDPQSYEGPAADFKECKVEPGSLPSDLNIQSMFAQQAGDGGLVKGVLAHSAALIGLRAFL